MDNLLIYTPQITNRIRYIFDLFFNEQMGLTFQLTNHIEEFRTATGYKIAYDKQAMDDALSFGAVYLLFEKGVHTQQINISDYAGKKVFFSISGSSLALPFDPFAASFYLVSRYEEYFPHAADKHGRFMAEESLAYKHGFLKTPLVNHYINWVANAIQSYYPSIQIVPRKFKFVPTYDIDSAYKYLNKGFIRNLGGLAKDLATFDFTNAKERLKVNFNLKKDPFDTYDWIIQLHQQYGGSPIFFFLVGDYHEYDKNISISMPAYQSLIKAIADQAVVGIHPSYESNSGIAILRSEIKRLSRVLRRDIWKSRQHFLKLEIPNTYNNLIDNDITQDYSMGYSSQLGFRASFAGSFYFYNLDIENKTSLRIYPFAIMDATLLYYQKKSANDAKLAIQSIINETKEVKGLLVTLWHNNTFCEEREFVGWKDLYEEMVMDLN